MAGLTFKVTSSNALTPGNSFVIFFISRIYSLTPSVSFLPSLVKRKYQRPQSYKLPQKPPPDRNTQAFGAYMMILLFGIVSRCYIHIFCCDRCVGNTYCLGSIGIKFKIQTVQRILALGYVMCDSHNHLTLCRRIL